MRVTPMRFNWNGSVRDNDEDVIFAVNPKTDAIVLVAYTNVKLFAVITNVRTPVVLDMLIVKICPFPENAVTIADIKLVAKYIPTGIVIV